MTPDRPVLGISFMLAFCVLAPMGDSIAKLLGEKVPLIQLLLTRFGVQAALLIPLALATSISLKMSPRVLRLTVIRTILHIIGIGAMFTSLRYLPLADAVAIAFVMPFIMLILGYYFLNEAVGTRRIVACVVGFIGTLLVIQPSFAQVGWPALLPVVVAVVFALFMLVTRQVAKETDPIALQSVSGVIATAILAVVLFIFEGQHASLEIISPDQPTLWLLAAIGIIGTVAHLFMTWSLRFAPSTTLAPMQYLEIPFATIIGFAIFGDWPNALAMTGILITISAGLYVILRENSVAKRAAEHRTAS